MDAIQFTAQFLATLSCSLFAGASVYINLVEHPARLECGTEIAATEFPPNYRRATIMQASLAILGLLSSIVVWLKQSNVWWLVGGILLVAVVPFTLIFILPTNKRLLDPSLDKKSERAAQLLSYWGQLHAVRSFLSVIALIIYLCLLIAS